MAKIISTEARLLAYNAIHARYFAERPAGSEDGLTLSEVHEAALSGSRLGSRNRVQGILAAMQSAKLITIEQSKIDKRQRICKLTEIGLWTAQEFRKSLLHHLDHIQGTNWHFRAEES